MRIIFIRHPETHANVNKLIYGRSESDYSEKGLKSISWVIDHLSERNIDRIYASPLQRAAILAEAIGSRYGLPVSFHEELIEMNFGVFENLTVEEAAEQHRDQYQKFMENYAAYAIPDGESFQNVFDRLSVFMQEIISRDGTSVIVTHGMVIRAAIAYIMNISLDDVWHFSTQPASILEFEYSDQYGVLHELTSPDIGK